MREGKLSFALKFAAAVLFAALATQFSFALPDSRTGEFFQEIAPAYGVGIGVALAGGPYFIVAALVGALIPAAFFFDDPFAIFSIAAGVAVASGASYLVVGYLKAGSALDRIRDTLLIFGLGIAAATALGALVQSLLIVAGIEELRWESFRMIAATNLPSTS